MPLPGAAIAALIDAHAAALRLWLAGRCASPDDAVQEAFCRLAVQDPPPDRPAAWLYRVAGNLAGKQRVGDERRRRREAERSVPEAFHPEPSARLEQCDALAAVARLEYPLREVLVARLWGELTLAEIGELCGISAATAMRRYETALEQIRQGLESCKTRHR